MIVQKDYILSNYKLVSYCAGSSLTVLLYAAMYLISLWDPYSGLAKMEVVTNSSIYEIMMIKKVVLNLDTSSPSAFKVGANIESLIFNMNGSTWSSTFNWKKADTSVTRSSLIQAIELNQIWACVIIPSGISQDFLSNTYPSTQLQTTQQLSKTTTGVEVIFNQGRAYSAENLMLNSIQFSLIGLSKLLAKQLTTQANLANLNVNAGWEIEPLVITVTNLHPVKVFGYQLTTALFFFLMWLGSAIGVTVVKQDYYKRLFKKKSQTQFKYELILLMFPIKIGAFFVLSHALGAWCIVFAINGMGSFSSSTNDTMGPLKALVFLWYIGLCPLFLNNILYQLLPVNVFGVVTSLSLVSMLVSAGSIFDYYQIPDFFKFGYVLPMRYAIRQLKFMFFGALANTITVNMIMITLWVIVPGIVYFGMMYYKIRNYMKMKSSKSLLD